MGAEAAVAAPPLAQPAPEQTQDAPTATEGEGAAEGSKSVLDLATENAALKERIKHSTEQGVRVAEDLKGLKEELAQLKKGNQQPAQAPEQFPAEAQYVKYWMEEGEMTEKQARAEYRRELSQWNDNRFIRTQLAALQNVQRFEAEQRERGLATLNPEAKEAEDFWKDIPAMDAMPITEKITAMKNLRTRMTPSGRDTTAIKAASGGPTGSANRGAATMDSSADDAEAKKAGFPSYKAMQEMTRCTTAEDYAAYKKRWKLK